MDPQTSSTIDEITKLISNLGVPVAILVWTFWRGDRFLTSLTKKLDSFAESLNKITIYLEALTAVKKG